MMGRGMSDGLCSGGFGGSAERIGNPEAWAPYAGNVPKGGMTFLAAAMVLGEVALAQPREGLFDLPGDRVVRVVVTTTGALPELPAAAARDLPEMVLRTAGVLEVIEGRRLLEVRGLSPRNAPVIGRPPDAKRVCFIHLVGSHSGKTIEVVATDDGLVVGEQTGVETQRPPRAALNRVRFERLSAGWSAYRGKFEATGDPIATVFDMPTPYMHGAFTFDLETMDERFYSGVRLRETYKLDRVLGEDPISVRLPRGYDPARPAGLLVWVSPTRDGSIPGQFFDALDELYMICIGAHHSGNTRLVNTRYQLALDGIATASERYHIDPERIYVTGMSGGGRVSSMLAACFPDVFAGSVPIVGMSIYEITNRGDGAKWNRGYYRPPAKLFRLFRKRRMAPMGGERDINYGEMRAAVRVLERDRVPVRFFEYDDMSHEMPRADRFAAALAWVDEPYREAARERRERAALLLERYARQYGGLGGDGSEGGAGEPGSDEARALLLKVMGSAPWSGPAWSALELLGR